jgi:protein gp37
LARPKNLWTGLTVCNQEEADEKIPVFLEVPGKKFLSIEPMLGPIDLDATCGPCHCWRDGSIKAVILGGETGPGARPLHPEWVRSVRDQCQSADVPFFFKQWGEWVHYTQYCFGVGAPCLSSVKVENELYRVGRKAAGRLLDGRTHNDLPWVQA